ncbi:efflux RND transporter periplasmic adaptor subunit, partial [bacterium]|nr:efflux RND transporter periplasmic adaptor subunit [bacterium]
VFLADLEAEQARFVKVNTGIRQDERLEILDPPLTGSVVVLGHHLLEDGTAITVPQSESQAGAVSKKENQDKK